MLEPDEPKDLGPVADDHEVQAALAVVDAPTERRDA